MITGPAQHEANVVWHDTTVHREQRATQGMTDLAHGAVRLRQVHHCGRAGAPPGRVRASRLPARRRQPASRPQLRPRLQRAPTAPRTSAGSVRSRRCSPTPGSSRSSRWSVRTARTGDWLAPRTTAPRSRSSRSSSTPRWRCARPATRRASTPRPVRGEIPDFTGVDDPYEAPQSPDLLLRPEDGDAATQTDHDPQLHRALQRMTTASRTSIAPRLAGELVGRRRLAADLAARSLLRAASVVRADRASRSARAATRSPTCCCWTASQTSGPATRCCPRSPPTHPRASTPTGSGSSTRSTARASTGMPGRRDWAVHVALWQRGRGHHGGCGGAAGAGRRVRQR